MKCPICEVELESKGFLYDEHGVNEEYDTCNSGCSLYSYQFAYGSSLTTIGCVEIKGHHTDSKEDIEFQLKIENMAIEYERDRLGLSLRAKECEAE